MGVNEIRKTQQFSYWFDSLADIKARARIMVRIDRLAAGNPGDTKSLGCGISELRIPYGPGYRVYYTIRARTVIILLAGGDKSSQSRDITLAKELAKNLKDLPL